MFAFDDQMRCRGGGLARSRQRFNEPGELSASAGGAVDALPGAV